MKRTTLLLVILTLVAAACGAAPSGGTSTTSTVTAGEQLGSLVAAQELWASAAPADYTIQQLNRVDAASDQPRTLAVRAGELVSLTGEGTMVEEIFATIEESIHDGADVVVDYHPDLGYPVRVVIDRDGDGAPDVHLEHQDVAAMPIVRSVHELRAAQRRWEAQNLDSYRYIFRFDCTCPEGGTFEIDVRDGRVASRRALDEAARNSSLDPGVDIDATFDDLEEWFVDSAELIEQGILAVDVRMDPKLGYPRWFHIEGDGLDDEFFPGRFSMVITIDLIGELEPVEPSVDLDDLQRLEEAHSQWQQAAIADYSYVVEVHCMCPVAASGPFAVTFRDGRLESAVLAGDRGAVATDVITIDKALEMIGSAVGAGTDVDVTYNERYGYPELVIIDPEAVAVDGGLAFSIGEFEVLQ